MRVLVFSSKSVYRGSAVGGAEISLKLLAETLAKKGHEVAFVTRQDRRLGWLRRVRVDGVEVVFLARLRLPGNSMAWIRSLNRFLDFLALLGFLATPGARGAQIVHTFATIPDTYDAVRARRILRARFGTVTRMAGLYWHELVMKDPALKKRVEWTFNNVDCINFISSGLEEMFERIRTEHEYEVQPKSSFVGDIGVDLETFARHWHAPPGQELIMVARFIDRAKRHDLLIRAFEAPGLEGATLHLVGDGPSKARWVAYCRERLSLRSRVVFHGQLSREEVAKLLRSSSIFCLATDYEGLSKSVIEAMSVGVPVCVSDVPPLNTYIRDGTNGFLVENRVECWSERLSELLTSPDSLQQASEEASALVRAKYDPARQVLLYEEEFERVWRGRRRT